MKKSILFFLTLTMFIVLFACGKDKKNPIEPSKKIEIITTVPKAAYIGDTITVVGKNFGEIQGTNFVSFAGTLAKEYITWCDNEIVVKVPEGAESGKLWIEVNDEKSNEVDFIIKESSIEDGAVTDIDGNVYKTVKIGNQLWMAENLNVSRYRNGDTISYLPIDADWRVAGNKREGAWCYYNNEIVNGVIYGKLYNWYAVNDARGLAPEGWHIPTEEELISLTNYLGGDIIAGGKLKEAGTAHWLSPNTGATNSSGFAALPGGQRYPQGGFYSMRNNGYWWSATEHFGLFSKEFVIFSNYAYLNISFNSNDLGLSVRCIKD
jgi:uncharacterized protein (TIGR02145 family)